MNPGQRLTILPQSGFGLEGAAPGMMVESESSIFTERTVCIREWIQVEGQAVGFLAVPEGEEDFPSEDGNWFSVFCRLGDTIDLATAEPDQLCSFFWCWGRPVFDPEVAPPNPFCVTSSGRLSVRGYCRIRPDSVE